MATTNATAPKGAPKKQSQGFTGIKSGLSVIIVCAVIAVCIFLFGFGEISNFKGGAETGYAFSCMTPAEISLEPANLMGTVYKGGFVVPIIRTLLITVVALSIERFFAIRNAYGRTGLTKFVADIKQALKNNDMAKAQQLCDKQRGSVANVVGATLRKYKEMEENTVLTKEQKILSIEGTRRSYGSRNAYDAGKPPHHRYYRNARYLGRSVRYGTRYDQVVLGNGKR